MSTATTFPSGPGAAIDQGLVPSTFSRPPQGAMAGLALVVSIATQPSAAARRVQHNARAEGFGVGTPTNPAPRLLGPPPARGPRRAVGASAVPPRPLGRAAAPAPA